MITEKIDSYLHKWITEEEDEEEDVQISSENAQKVIHLATMMDKKKEAPKMKRTVGKAMAGKPLSDSEREILRDVLGRFFRPEKGKFRRLMKKF